METTSGTLNTRGPARPLEEPPACQGNKASNLDGNENRCNQHHKKSVPTLQESHRLRDRELSRGLMY